MMCFRYKSFSTKSDNIGDITAKGEAQIAVIDLLGMVIGIAVSRLIGTDRTKIVAVFLALTFVDLLWRYRGSALCDLCMYAFIYGVLIVSRSVIGGSKVLVVFRARVLRSWWQAFAIKARINSAEILRIKDGVPRNPT